MLAALLQHRGKAASVEQLQQQIYLPDKGGSLQVEMLAGARRHNTLPVALALDDSPKDAQRLHAALLQDYPVMLLQRLRKLWLTTYHYAIVVGYDATADQFILRSGTNRRLFTQRHKFLRPTRAAGNWAYVLLEPDQDIPGFIEREQFLQASIAMESIGRIAMAAQAYKQGMRRWPEEYLFHFGLANTLIAQRAYKQAIQQLLEIQSQHPDHGMVLNNLAAALAEEGRFEEALRWIERGIDLYQDEKAALDVMCETYTSITNSAGTTRPNEPACTP